MENDELIELEDQVEEQEQDLTGRSIHTTSADAQVDSLYGRYRKGRLNIQPSYQRHYVWDAKKASLLIESILLGIPIPIIYLAEDQDNHVNVIDGQQRLTSLFSFIDGKLPNGKVFKLTGLNVFTDLKGKTFQDLSDAQQSTIEEYPLRTITFTKDSDPELQYEIFSRLNTGSVALNDQELRNCIYRGPFNDMIKELAEYDEFRKLLGLKAAHPRMKDVELVLRFLSFYKKTYINYASPSKSFLNDMMRENRMMPELDRKKLREIFKRAVLNTRALFGDNAFRRFYMGNEDEKEGYWDTKIFNVSLFEVTMDSMARIEPNVLMRHLDALREALITLMSTDAEFMLSISRASADKAQVTYRFKKWNDVVDSIIKDDKASARCFSYELKKRLFDANPVCAICGQQITCIDDAAVDHIEQYWNGGKTDPENARLTHRYCNCARDKYDKA